jgi:hypothetical protein
VRNCVAEHGQLALANGVDFSLETLARVAILEHAVARVTDFHEGTECGFENALAKQRPDGGIATARLFSPDPRDCCDLGT